MGIRCSIIRGSTRLRFRLGRPNTLTTSVRATVIIKPTQRGTIPVTMEFRHWITGEIEDQGRGVIHTRIEVT